MSSTSVGEIFQHSAPAHTYSTGSILVDQSTRLGVEFEFEGVNKSPNISDAFNSFWAQKQDGSLRGAGMEFTFSNPLFGKDAENAITWMVGEAVRLKYRTSIRTGLHVHLDIREMSPQQFINLSLIYALAEPFLFWWVGKTREESAFCVPWYYATKTAKSAGSILQAIKSSPAVARLHSDGYERYSALNFNALSRFGSVEFRHMEQTLNLKKIFAWVNLLLHIKQAACSLNALPDKITKDPYAFLVQVFGNKAEELRDFTREPLKTAFLKGQKTYVGLNGALATSADAWQWQWPNQPQAIVEPNVAGQWVYNFEPVIRNQE